MKDSNTWAERFNEITDRKIVDLAEFKQARQEVIDDLVEKVLEQMAQSEGRGPERQPPGPPKLVWRNPEEPEVILSEVRKQFEAIFGLYKLRLCRPYRSHQH